MKKANELKVIAMAEVDRKAAERKQRSINYLENRIVPEMEKAAAEGQMFIAFHVDAWVDMKLIVDELTANGYSCSKSGRTLRIDWL